MPECFVFLKKPQNSRQNQRVGIGLTKQEINIIEFTHVSPSLFTQSLYWLEIVKEVQHIWKL